MNAFKKYDRIPPPYATLFALGVVMVLGALLVFTQRDAVPFGLGIILGGILAIATKAAAEASDRQTWQRVRALFLGKEDDGPK